MWDSPGGYLATNAPPGVDIDDMLDCTSPGLPFTRKDLKFSGCLLKSLKQHIAVKKCVDLLRN